MTWIDFLQDLLSVFVQRPFFIICAASDWDEPYDIWASKIQVILHVCLKWYKSPPSSFWIAPALLMPNMASKSFVNTIYIYIHVHAVWSESSLAAHVKWLISMWSPKYVIKNRLKVSTTMYLTLNNTLILVLLNKSIYHTHEWLSTNQTNWNSQTEWEKA